MQNPSAPAFGSPALRGFLLDSVPHTACGKEAAHAASDRASTFDVGRGIRHLGAGNWQDSGRTKLDGDELHDGLQCRRGDLPNHLPRSIGSASEWCARQRHAADEHYRKHDLHLCLQHDPDRVPNKLFPFVPVSMIV
jgi:hypothetical protein